MNELVNVKETPKTFLDLLQADILNADEIVERDSAIDEYWIGRGGQNNV